MEKLNSDMIQEILARLAKTDFKSILQCRKVCRIWRSVMGKPKTGMLFLYYPKYSRRVEFYYRDQQSREMVNFDVSEEKQKIYKTVTKIGDMGITGWDFTFLGSCHGLICYKTCEHQLGNVMYISNPITGERIRLPKVVVYYHNYHHVGFGYCHSTNQYKIVSISYTGNGKQSVQVYTLGDGSGWRDKPDTTCTFLKSGVFANGALHWLIVDTLKPDNCHIQAFDLANETFRDLPSPPCQVPPTSYLDVTVEGDMYCACIHYDIKLREPMMDIWVFNKKNMNNCLGGTCFNSSPWSKVFSIRWNSDLAHKRTLLSLTDSEILLWQNGVLSGYDSTTCKKLWCDEGARGLGKPQATPYMNSLVSLKDLGEELVDC